jgi:hypothetical protein
VDQARGVEDTVGIPPAELPPGDPAQVVVDQRDHAAERLAVPLAVGQQKLGDVSSPGIARRLYANGNAPSPGDGKGGGW